jgi:hypothetical protein
VSSEDEADDGKRKTEATAIGVRRSMPIAISHMSRLPVTWLSKENGRRPTRKDMALEA